MRCLSIYDLRIWADFSFLTRLSSNHSGVQPLKIEDVDDILKKDDVVFVLLHTYSTAPSQLVRCCFPSWGMSGFVADMFCPSDRR